MQDAERHLVIGDEDGGDLSVGGHPPSCLVSCGRTPPLSPDTLRGHPAACGQLLPPTFDFGVGSEPTVRSAYVPHCLMTQVEEMSRRETSAEDLVHCRARFLTDYAGFKRNERKILGETPDHVQGSLEWSHRDHPVDRDFLEMLESRPHRLPLEVGQRDQACRVPGLSNASAIPNNVSDGP